MKPVLVRKAVTLALVLAASIAATPAGEGFEGGVLAGMTRFERALTGYESSFEPTLGLRAGYVFSRRLAWYVDAVYATTDTIAEGEAAVVEARTGLEYLFQPARRVRWFAGGGFGLMRIDLERSDDFDSGLYSVGFGQRIGFGRGMHLRWEFRVDVSTSRGGRQKTLNDGKILVGWIWGRAGKADP